MQQHPPKHSSGSTAPHPHVQKPLSACRSFYCTEYHLQYSFQRRQHRHKHPGNHLSTEKRHPSSCQNHTTAPHLQKKPLPKERQSSSLQPTIPKFSDESFPDTPLPSHPSDVQTPYPAAVLHRFPVQSD